MLNLTPEKSALLLEQYRRLLGKPSADFGDSLATIVATATDLAIPGAILPRQQGKQLLFYALAPTPQLWRQLRPLLLAFAGPTLTDFIGLPAQLDTNDSVEAWLAAQNAIVARLRTRPDTQTITIRALQRLVALLSHSEIPEREHSLPTGLLLKRFREALLGSDLNTATTILDQLAIETRLDALNLLFLRVRLYEARADWAGLRTQDWFNQLCRTRRPPAVSSALLTALYHTELTGQINNPDACLEHFRQQVRPTIGDLLNQPPPNPTPAIWKVFALEAASAKSTKQAWFSDLIAVAATDADLADWLNRLGLDTQAKPTDTVSIPTAELPPSTPLTRLQMLATLPTTLDNAREALLLTPQVNSLEGFTLARQCVKNLPVEEHQRLLEPLWLRELWRLTLEACGEQPVQNWLDWLQAIQNVAFDQALTVAERGVEEWSIDQQLADPRPVSEIAKALDGVSGSLAEARLQEAVPLLVDWLRQAKNYPCGRHLPLYRALLLRIALNTGRSTHDLVAASHLIEAQLAVGLDEPGYRELLEALNLLADAASGRRGVDWLLDMLELTLQHPTADPSGRGGLWHTALGKLRPLLSNLTPVQIALLYELAQSLGIQAVGPEVSIPLPPLPTTPSAFAALNGLRLAIYTLTERAGKQAADILAKWAPGLRVELNHDHVGTPALKNLAEQADIFVMVTQSAKHAATTFIQQHRRNRRTLLFPAGRGASSILAKIQEYAEAVSDDRIAV